MAVHDSAPVAKRSCCPVTSELLVKRLKLEGVSVPNSARLATLLNTANEHGLLTLAPEPQTSMLDLPAEVIENILHMAISDPGRQHHRADVLFAVASTCKPLYHLITADPNSVLWRTAWSAVARYGEEIPSSGVIEEYGAPHPFMLRVLGGLLWKMPASVKLLARDSCEFCTNISRRLHKVHWQLGVRCCTSCFNAQTCTKNWAKKHCKLPADQVESLPSEEIYSRYMPGQRNFRVLKRDLGPLLQEVHGEHVSSVTIYEKQCADAKQEKADATAERKRQAAERKALKLAKQQERAEKKRLKEEQERTNGSGSQGSS